MFRNNLRLRMTALLFVVALMVAGTRPAEAEDFGWRQAWDWLSGLWGGITFQTGDCGPEINPSGGCLKHQSSADVTDAGLEVGPGPTTNGECGYEIDPSGVLVPRCKPTGAASGG